MPVDRITERIIKEAEREALTIKEGALKEAESIREKARREAEALREDILSRGRIEASERKRRILAAATMEARKLILEKKQRIIEEIFKIALGRLESLEDEEYRKLIKDILLRSVNSGEEEVMLSKRDRERLGEKFLTEVNETLAKEGRKGNLKFSSQMREILGGFFLRSGGVEINCSFDSLVKSSRDDLELKIAEILFSEK